MERFNPDKSWSPVLTEEASEAGPLAH